MVYSIRVSHLRSRYCLILSVLANFASRIEFSCIWTPRNGYETEEGIHKERKKERKSERKKYWRPWNFIGLAFSINLWMSNWVACNRQNVRFISSLVSTICFRSLPSKKRVQVKKKFKKITCSDSPQFTQKRNTLWELNAVDSVAQKRHNLSEKMNYDGLVQRILIDISVYHHPMNAHW